MTPVPEPPPRTLVAVIADGGDVHTLYFDDGTVVGYEPARGRVVRVHQLPADFGPAAAVTTRPAPAPALPPVAGPHGPDRRYDETGDPPPDGGRRAEDTGMRLP